MNASPRRVLVVGSGGREHALVRACLRSPLAASVEAAPGNGGMAPEVRCHPLDLADPHAAVALAREIEADFVIVGPEAPLAAGFSDALRAAGIVVYGPGEAGARLEASKAAAKAFMARHGIPTARERVFDASEDPQAVERALRYIAEAGHALVVKADGLAAGKGVIVPETMDETRAACREMLSTGGKVLLEERLHGEEVSIMLMVGNGHYVALPPSQDHKRIGEGDTGLNTGGMGAYAPTTVSAGLEEDIRRTIIEPSVQGLVADGIDFRGTLYIGLMVTSEGPKVLEYNVRFGDPECQVLLPLLETDPLELMLACAEDRLADVEVRIRQESAAIVVLAAEGYPGTYRLGDPISLPAELPEGVEIIHAGTRLETNHLVTAGGRVLGVVARAGRLEEALARAYSVCDQIEWRGRVFRRDIGVRELHRRRESPAKLGIDPMSGKLR